LVTGLAQIAVTKIFRTELVPPSYFSTSTSSGLLSNFTSAILLSSGSNTVNPHEKRPTFAFHRRIRDDPTFYVELPSDARQWYRSVVKTAGSTIHNLVQEWTAEWLAGTRTDVEAEVRLRGMLEEVIWGNVIWYGIGGWASRGDSGRVMNADHFLCVPPHMFPSILHPLTFWPFETVAYQVYISSPRPFSSPASFSRTKVHRHPLHSNPAHFHLPIACSSSKRI